MSLLVSGGNQQLWHLVNVFCERAQEQIAPHTVLVHGEQGLETHPRSVAQFGVSKGTAPPDGPKFQALKKKP